jgi:hypothetical protein
MKIDGGDAPITKYPKFAQHVKNLADLRRRVADYYVHADFRDQEGIEVEAPGNVLVKVYRNKASHRLGIVIAETAGEKTPIRLKTIGQFAAVSQLGTRDDVLLSDGNTLSIEPYEVQVLCGNETFPTR